MLKKQNVRNQKEILFVLLEPEKAALDEGNEEKICDCTDCDVCV